MSDLALHRRSDGNFDLDFNEKSMDLLTSEGLENAIVISIGTFARSEKLKSVANLQPSIGGWWGDHLDEKGTLGGHLYECNGNLNERLCRDVERAVSEALKWLVDDGVASSVAAQATIADEEYIDVVVTISKPMGESMKFKYEKVWKATDGI